MTTTSILGFHSSLQAARWSTVVLICTCYFIMPLLYEDSAFDRSAAARVVQHVTCISAVSSAQSWYLCGAAAMAMDCLGFLSHGLIYGTAAWLAFGLVSTSIASKFFVKERACKATRVQGIPLNCSCFSCLRVAFEFLMNLRFFPWLRLGSHSTSWPQETPRITKEESSQLAMVVVWVSTICILGSRG
eukprot:Skav221758  [mRNA]  locus=scaffold1904:43652:46003:+ [translate_table: standard]